VEELAMDVFEPVFEVMGDEKYEKYKYFVCAPGQATCDGIIVSQKQHVVVVVQLMWKVGRSHFVDASILSRFWRKVKKANKTIDSEELRWRLLLCFVTPGCDEGSRMPVRPEVKKGGWKQIENWVGAQGGEFLCEATFDYKAMGELAALEPTAVTEKIKSLGLGEEGGRAFSVERFRKESALKFARNAPDGAFKFEPLCANVSFPYKLKGDEVVCRPRLHEVKSEGLDSARDGVWRYRTNLRVVRWASLTVKRTLVAVPMVDDPEMVVTIEWGENNELMFEVTSAEFPGEGRWIEVQRGE
jgi:hypothetical protein